MIPKDIHPYTGVNTEMHALKHAYMHAYIPYMHRCTCTQTGATTGKVQQYSIILAEREEECDIHYMMLKEFSVHLRV